MYQNALRREVNSHSVAGIIKSTVFGTASPNV